MIDTAKYIVQTLFDAGYTAYYAGGWVRDFLRGEPSEDVDIATNAPPEKIQELFPKTIPVGIAFGVVIVVENGHNFEVTTFRKDHPYHDGRHPDGVDFSTPEKDAERRDFTINGMFYDPLTETIHDFVDGQADLKAGIIRAIGDPNLRFTEDRLRMLRAVRFAHRFDFKIDKATERAISQHAETLFPSVSIERVWQELTKMARHHFQDALLTLHRLHLLPTIFPTLKPLTLEEIERRLLFLPYFPLNTPAILSLLELFPNSSLQERLDLCTFLKTSTHEMKLVEYFHQGEQLLQSQEVEGYDWAHFYAGEHGQLFLRVQASKTFPPERQNFVETHFKRQNALSAHILRLKRGTPLLTSAHLEKAGISPGPRMGELLRAGERLAINNDLSSAEEVLSALQSSPLWNT